MSKETITPEEVGYLVSHLCTMMASMVAPLIERYGEEAIEHLKKPIRERTLAYYKKVFDKMGIKKRDLETYNKIFYQMIVAPLEFAGHRESVVELNEKRRVVRVTRCPECEGWREVTDHPEILCKLDHFVGQAMTEAFNPNLIYTKYDIGLPYGKPYCEIVNEFK